jgi:manganese efflux pump family protein
LALFDERAVGSRCKAGNAHYRHRVLAILLVAVSVGLDNFAAAIGIGLSGLDAKLRLQVALVFGVFEGGMPVVGLLIGRSFTHVLGTHAHVIGGVILALTGLYGIVTSALERRKGHESGPLRRSRGLGHLIVVGAALSIDNLIVGFALGTYHVSLIVAALVIATVSVGMSLVGLELGRQLGTRVGEYGELLGGAVLILVGGAIGFGFL